MNLTLKKARRGQTNNMKAIAIYIAIKICHASLTTIAHAFGDSARNGIQNNYKRFLTRSGQDIKLLNDADKIMRQINNKEQGTT